MVSTFLSHTKGSHSVAKDLANKLQTTAQNIICVSSYRSGLLRGLDMIFTAIRRRREYDLAIVGLYSGRAFLWGEAVSWLLEKLGCPFVISLHGGSLPEFARLHPRRVTETLRKAAAVTAPSNYLAERMRVYRQDILLLPNPIEIERYEFRLRDQIKPNLIWLRSLQEIYNPLLAIKVAARLRENFPDLRLTMVGPDKGDGTWQQTANFAARIFPAKPYEEDTKKTSETGIDPGAASCEFVAGDFLMTGGIPNAEVPRWLNRGDIFLNTTNVDNTPISVIEAMACGLPIVSTNVGGLPYLLEDGEDALLVPPNDAEAMSASVRRVLTEPGLAAQLSRNARRKAETFDWANVLPMWRELLGKVR